MSNELNMQNPTQIASDKDKRRQLKKLRRFQHQLFDELQVQPSDQPSKIIALCNAGLSTGLRESDVLSTFDKYGCIENVRLIPAKSFCFIIFHNIESATMAYTETHLKNCLSQHGQPLYLTYLPTVPRLYMDDDNEIPSGLTLIEDFISVDEERMLLSSVTMDNLPEKNDMKNRRVKHFGYEFIYGINNIDVNSPLDDKIPSSCDFIWDRLRSHGHPIENPPEQLTVNQYSPGQGIPSHVDTHSAFLSPLISLSMGSDIVMEFKKNTANGKKCCKIKLPARSILLLDGSARYEWTHGISPKSYDLINGQMFERQTRTSFTFRWIRRDKICKCNFPEQCDTHKNQSDIINVNSSQAASAIEKELVHQVYDEIANHFSETRSKIWPCVQNFIDDLKPGSILIDVGCGNGKNMNIRSDILSIGLEYNGKLAAHAALKVSDMIKSVLIGDCLNLPFNSNQADAVISIAVFHHLVSEERRIRAIGEVVRILKSGGRALISVWAQDQTKDGVKSSYLKQDRKNRHDKSEDIDADITRQTNSIKLDHSESLEINLPIHTNRKQFAYQDMLVPWKLKGKQSESEKTFMRFYHVFKEGELERVCKSFADIVVVNSFYEQGNWCIVFQKT